MEMTPTVAAAAALSALPCLGLAAWFVRANADRTEPAIGLGIFRILLGISVVGEAGQALVYRHYYRFPDQSPAWYDEWSTPFLAAWAVAGIALTAGFATRLAAVAAWWLTMRANATHQLVYHGDLVLSGLTLLAVFAPLGRAWSVDALLSPRLGAREVSRAWTHLVVLCGVGLVYFDSTIYKWASPMWREGLGFWAPASSSFAVWVDLTPVLDREWLCRLSGWLTLAFETVFLVVMWFERLRPWVLVTGVVLHLGIVVVFPIPWFGLCEAAVYAAMLPRSWAERLAGKRIAPTPDATKTESVPQTDGTPEGKPAEVGAEGTPGPEGRLSRPARYLLAAGLAVVFWCQVWTSVGSLHTVTQWGPLEQFTPLGRGLQPNLRIHVGMMGHALFLDPHFQSRRSLDLDLVASDGTLTPIGMYDAGGMCTWLNSGRIWGLWTWAAFSAPPQGTIRMSGPTFARLVVAWCRYRRVPPWEAVIRLRSKVVESPTGWIAGHLRRQMAQPWVDVADFRIVGGRPVLVKQWGPDEVIFTD